MDGTRRGFTKLTPLGWRCYFKLRFSQLQRATPLNVA